MKITFYLLFSTIFISPIIIGLIGIISASLSYIPPLNLTTVNIDGFRSVMASHGIWHSLTLTLSSTIISTFFSCFIAFSILQSTWKKNIWNKIELLLSPLLAMPHLSFAIGFAFLFSSTGLFARFLSLINNIEFISIINDRFNIGFILVIVLKEVPFLLFMSIPILQQLKIESTTKMAMSFGYQRHQIWWKCLFPQWLNKMRLPIFAVITYAASVVDVSLIVASNTPMSFAVLLWQWLNNPEINLQIQAGAGAIILSMLCLVLLAVHYLFEWFITRYYRYWQISGRFGLLFPGTLAFQIISTIIIMSLPILFLWSMAQRWSFPNLLPTQFSTRFWVTELPVLFPIITNTLIIGFISSTFALIFALLCHEYKIRNTFYIPPILLLIPILIPQLPLLFGIQIAAISISNQYYALVIWSHLFFVFPYIYLTLDGPWRSFDQRLIQTSLSLGKSPLSSWFKIKLPTLFSAIIYAWAIGISVSIIQYLPTQMLGAGRVTTLTTETVTLSSGFDRRITAIYSLLQALLPLLFFSVSMLIGRYRSGRSTKFSSRHRLINNRGSQ